VHHKIAESEAGKLGGKMKGHTMSTIVQEAQAKYTGNDELFEFVKSLGIDDAVMSSPTAPGGTAVWVPSKQFAAEVYDIDHARSPGIVFDRRGTRKKYDTCKALNVRLMQFYGDEWANHGDICRSMIRNALGCASMKLHARDCELVTLTTAESKPFCDANHISGSTRSSKHFGLRHPEHGLVAVVTTRRPIQKKYGYVCELARMCFLQGASVRGGASKLLSHVLDVAKADGFEGVLSYSELRYGEGNVYEKCGFTLVGEALTNYGYSDGIKRHDRFKFRAQPGKPEKQVIEEAGVHAMWGCGNKIYFMKFA